MVCHPMFQKLFCLPYKILDWHRWYVVRRTSVCMCLCHGRMYVSKWHIICYINMTRFVKKRLMYHFASLKGTSSLLSKPLSQFFLSHKYVHDRKIFMPNFQHCRSNMSWVTCPSSQKNCMLYRTTFHKSGHMRLWGHYVTDILSFIVFLSRNYYHSIVF